MTEESSKIQRRIDTYRAIRFNHNVSISTLGDVIDVCITHQSPTYFEDTGTRQCHAGSRGVTDIYRVAKFYLPNVSYEEVVNALEKLVFERKVTRTYCGGVRRLVHTRGYAVQYGTAKAEINKSLDTHRLNKTIS